MSSYLLGKVPCVTRVRPPSVSVVQNTERRDFYGKMTGANSDYGMEVKEVTIAVSVFVDIFNEFEKSNIIRSKPK